MTYLFDSNIILASLRSTSFAQYISEEFSVDEPNNTFAISTITIGELRAIALKNHWGSKRIFQLTNALSQYLIIPINRTEIHEQYARLDAYSQGKLAQHPLPQGLTARNMGKNDLWIAATAAALKATLVTTDKDFNHLAALVNTDYVNISQFT